ncbi:putative HNT1-adenosine 5'-monophosphoramidase [Lentinula raphanica]|nr:putative HNT1-adenosine 5'-monophosphoramidase [Lentinula raphanica]
MATKSLASCIFCKIIKGEIPSFKLLETDLSYAFLDIGPIATMHELPDEYLIALAQGAEDYNILQNNGALAHQVVQHTHFHVIPKPNEKEGLIVGWPAKEVSKEELQKVYEELKGKL